jgi:trk system potassium uptake protein TrkH
VRRIVAAFAVVLALGTTILMLPPASATGDWTAPVVAFFTAVSAFTGTGLVVVDTGTYWSGLGQLVILGLVMIGGVGVMASTAAVLVARGRRPDLHSRLMISGMAGGTLGQARTIVIRTVAFAAIVIIAGAATLAALVWSRDPDDVLGAAWWALFHAASAFNNAGFDLNGGFSGMIPFASDAAVLLVLMTLMFVGSIGIVVCADLWQARATRRTSVETRLVVTTTVVLVGLGWLGLLAFEWDNLRTLGALGLVDRVLNAAFASVSARSTGMNTLDVGALRPESLTLTTALMFIGGAVGSTAGGIRVNTLAVLAIVVAETLRRHREPVALGRRLGPGTVNAAITVTAIGALVVVGGVLLVELLSMVPVAELGTIAFETVSAFGTVGLSTGVTPSLGDAAQLALAACMLVGRLSILGLAIVFAHGFAAPDARPPRGSIHVA